VSHDERSVKRGRLMRILDEGNEARPLLLTSAASLSWYLEGARVDVGPNLPPVLAVVVGEDVETVYCLANERERLMAEELPKGMESVSVPWHVPLAAAVGPEAIDEAAFAVELRQARAALLPAERDRYRQLSAECAAVLTDVLSVARPQHRERDLARHLAAGIMSIGADPTVVLVAGSSRHGYRHPVPSSAPLGERVMAVVCARRHGLIANLTRWVRFSPAGQEEKAREERLLAVEAETLRATVPGRTLREVLADIAAAYPRHGFAADEWLRHHQGGPTGYAGRDPRATPEAIDRVVAGGAFAWNPSVPGGKVEDTILLDAETGDFEVLTVDPRWPSIRVDDRERPAELTL
jgi:hypothetical protein